MSRISNRIRITGALAPFAAMFAGRNRAAAQDGTGPIYPAGEEWPIVGWHEAAPETHGLPRDFAAQIDAWAAQSTPLLTSLLVVHGGELVVNNHYNGFTPDQTFMIWSVTKSVTSIATGIAFREGLLTSLDQTLGELIPDRIPASADPRVWNISLYQLLTSTAGWVWDGRINFSRHDETDDLDAMLARPLAFDPGSGYEYDNTNSNLLSYIIQVQSGMTMAEYLQPRLFDPLGIPEPEWIHMYGGETRGAGGLYLRPADLAKIGYLMLRNGEWAGYRIVDPEWIDQSTVTQASGTSATSGANIGGGGSYGYQWWVKQPNGIPSYYGSGYGGQTLYVVPDLDLVVVSGVASTEASRPDLQQPCYSLVEQLIVPTVAGV